MSEQRELDEIQRQLELEEIYESVRRENPPFTQTDNTIVPIIVSRMNPFTPGHVILLTEALMYAARNNLHQVSIILSQSWDDKKNPLDPHTKQRLIYSVIPNLKEYLSFKFTSEGSIELAKAIQRIQVVIELMGDPLELLVDEAAQEEDRAPKAVPKEDAEQLKASRSPALTTLYRILKDYYKYPREGLKVVVFCGEDRNYEFIRDSLKKFLPSVSYQEINLERPDMQRLIDMSTTDLINLLEAGELSPRGISGSLVRNVGKSGNEAVFSQLMEGTYLRPEHIREVYDIIQGLPEAVKPGPSNPKKGLPEAVEPGPSNPKKTKGGGTLKKKYKKNIKKTRKHKRKHTKRNKK
jgi:hypothetical protein